MFICDLLPSMDGFGEFTTQVQAGIANYFIRLTIGLDDITFQRASEPDQHPMIGIEYSHICVNTPRAFGKGLCHCFDVSVLLRVVKDQ
jgi:hypothetical protein